MTELCCSARDLFEQEKFEEALSLYARAFHRNPFEQEATLGFVKVLKATGDFAFAARILESSRDYTLSSMTDTRYATPEFRLQAELERMSGAAVSILLPTKDRLPLLLDFLQSLPAAASNVPCEVLLLYSKPDAEALTLQAIPGVRLFDQEQYFSGRPSWPRMMNFLLSRATGRYIMYASDDIMLASGSLATAVSTLDAAGEHCCGVAMAYRNLTAENEWKDFGVDLTLGRQILINYGLLRKDQAIEAGGFSHAYQFYCADGDLCLKLLQRGRIILPEFKAPVVHNDVQDKLKASNVHATDEDIALYNATWEPVFGPLDRRRRRIQNADAPEARLSHVKIVQAEQQCQLATVKRLLHESAPVKLHLGCGEQHFDDYVNIDFPSDMHTAQNKSVADIFIDIKNLDFPNCTIEEIRSHHVFEHFDRPKTLALLIRWSRWLVPGGRLIIETPDVLGSFRQIVEDNLTFPQKQAVMRHIFGSHEASWAIHCDGWYAEKFTQVLGVFGFQITVRNSVWDRPPWLHNTTVVAVKVRELNEAELMHAAEQVHAWHMVDASPCEMRKLQYWTSKTAKAAGIETTS
jgi:predicted SAM-dependent methyltransferase